MKTIFNHSLGLVIIASFIASLSSFGSAYGYDYWGVHVIKDIPIPSGQLFGAVEGDGVRVDKAGGNFLSAGNLCNWRIEVEFSNTQGHIYKTVKGQTHESCNRQGGEKFLINQRLEPGRACIRLYTAFSHRVASVCHNIVR